MIDIGEIDFLDDFVCVLFKECDYIVMWVVWFCGVFGIVV